MPGDITLTARDREAAPSLPSAELAPDSSFGRYVIRHKLGAGGMGVVYAAWDGELDRDVALKIIRPVGNMGAKHARLRREARAMARLSHPNVVPVFDIGTHQGQLYIAMELVRGSSLRAWLDPDAKPDARRDSWREVVRVFVQAGRGLIAAHAGGVLHRDFKPDNVLVGHDGAARITDFGLARELAIAEPGEPLRPADRASAVTHDDDGDGDGNDGDRDRPLSLPQVTGTGAFSGTPAYMAPELLRGATGDAKTDQFAFCVALFEVLYGVRPFRAGDASSLFDAILAGRVVRPAAAHEVPGWLHAVVVRGLATGPDDRWPSMAELLASLEEGLGRRRRVAIAGVAALAALGIGALVAARTTAPAAPGCLASVRAGDLGVAILVCKDEYARTRDPKTGALLANALYDSRNLHDASLLATELLATPAHADALYILGNVAARDGKRDEALRSFGLARDLHCQARPGACAADWLAIAGQADDPLGQLDALDRAASYARIARDAQTEGYIAVATALPLSSIGARDGAEHALARAEALLTSPGDRLQLAVTRGDVLQNLGDDARAAAVLAAAIAGLPPGSTHRALSMQLNLAYSLAESGQVAEAKRALADADALDPSDRAKPDRLAVAARVAWRGDELPRAAELAAQALARTPADDDDAVEREVLVAEIALAAHQLDATEAHARAALALIDAQQARLPAPAALRSWLVTDHRRPHELLFASLAIRGDAAGALAELRRVQRLDAFTARFVDAHGRSKIGAELPIAQVALDAPITPPPPLPPRALVTAYGARWRITIGDEHTAPTVEPAGPADPGLRPLQPIAKE